MSERMVSRLREKCVMVKHIKEEAQKPLRQEGYFSTH